MKLGIIRLRVTTNVFLGLDHRRWKSSGLDAFPTKFITFVGPCPTVLNVSDGFPERRIIFLFISGAPDLFEVFDISFDLLMV